MNHQPLRLLVIFLSLHTTVTYAQIRQHQGAADPLSEGFTGGVSGGAQVGPVKGDQGRDAWSMELNGGRNIAIYQHFLSTSEQSAATTVGWELSLNLRMVDGSAGAHFYTGSSLYSLTFRVEADGDPVVEAGPRISSPGVTYTLEGVGSTYHQYRLIYDPAHSTADLWVDGVERISDLAGISLAADPRIDWGAGQSITSARWNEVTFSVVPEPGAPVLLVLGGSALGLPSMRRRILGAIQHRRDP